MIVGGASAEVMLFVFGEKQEGRCMHVLAIRKLNNNAVICRDSQGREIVALGKGVGFGSDFPRELPMSAVERTFYRIDAEGQRIMQDLPADVVLFTAKVMDIAENELPYELSPNAVLVMADHLAFAIARQEKGIRFDMTLSYDVRQLYPLEYKIARFIVKRVQRDLGVELPQEEIASIAMNLVNTRAGSAVGTTSDRAQTFENLLNEITEIVERDFRTIIDRDAFAYARFATHIQYLFRRVQLNESVESENLQMYEKSREEFPDLARCVDHIGACFERELNIALTDEEKLYLMLHVNRIRS